MAQEKESRQTDGRPAVVLNERFVREYVNRETGESFYRATLPSGVEVDGVDLGGWSFTSQYASPSKFSKSDVYMRFPEGWELNLEKTVRDEEASEAAGRFVARTDESGRPLKQQLRLPASVVADAVRQERARFREKRAAESEGSPSKAAPEPSRGSRSGDRKAERAPKSR